MSFGIPDKSFGIILDTLGLYPEIKRAAIFGSRAMGNYKNGSDVDLVIYGSEITPGVATTVRVKLNEDSLLPYHFDVIHYDSLKDKPIKEHIDQFAKVIYPA